MSKVEPIIHDVLTALMSPNEGAAAFVYLSVILIANTYHAYRTWKGL